MTFLHVLIMIVAVIGMIIGLAKQKQGHEWGRPLTVACAVVALLLALSSLLFGGRESAKKMMEMNTTYQLLSGEKVGQYIADEFGSADIAVLLDNNPNTKDFMDGLRKGLGTSANIVKEISPDIAAEQKRMMKEAGIDVEDMTMMTMDPSMMSADMFEDLLNDAGEADVIVSLLGLPYDYLQLDFWRDKDRPNFVAVTIFSVMPPLEVKSMIELGHISTWITTRPDGDFSLEDKPKNMEEAFSNRYILVDKDNLAETVEQYPGLFMEAP